MRPPIGEDRAQAVVIRAHYESVSGQCQGEQ
jgi:hypothetical protein